MDATVEHVPGPPESGYPPAGTPAGPASRPGWWRYALFTLAGCVLAVAGGGAGAALALHYDGHTTTVASAPPASPRRGRRRRRAAGQGGGGRAAEHRYDHGDDRHSAG